MSTHRRVVSFVFVIMMTVGLAAHMCASPKVKAIAWQTDYKKALALASASKKIVMIDFYSEG